MVRAADDSDIFELALMLKAMAHELAPDNAIDDFDVYLAEVFKYMNDETMTVYISDTRRGFFMVKDDSEPIYKDLKRYIGTKVYIKEEYRKTRLLKDFYDVLFRDFPDGDILGLTEIDSEHIEVLNKRHELIAQVYKMKRS